MTRIAREISTNSIVTIARCFQVVMQSCWVCKSKYHAPNIECIYREEAILLTDLDTYTLELIANKLTNQELKRFTSVVKKVSEIPSLADRLQEHANRYTFECSLCKVCFESARLFHVHRELSHGPRTYGEELRRSYNFFGFLSIKKTTT